LISIMGQWGGFDSNAMIWQCDQRIMRRHIRGL
jgi:hypothetical protein